MTTSANHECAGCGTPAPTLACFSCWQQLPSSIRGRITRAAAARRRYPQDSDIEVAHLTAISDAKLWYREHRRPR
jgi:hypothetical protein